MEFEQFGALGVDVNEAQGDLAVLFAADGEDVGDAVVLQEQDGLADVTIQDEHGHSPVLRVVLTAVSRSDSAMRA